MLLLITNRKSYTRFRLVPKSTILDDPELTLNGYYALCSITRIYFGAHHKNLNVEHPYYQQQKCIPGIAVSSEIKFMRIFGGVLWLGGFKWEWGPRKWRFSLIFAGKGASNDSVVVQNGDFRFFRSLYLPNLHIQGHNYYIVLCSPLVALHWRRNGWPWMTLSGHFALKSGPSSASNGLAFWLSAKIAWKFAELRIYPTVSGNRKI